MPDYPALAEFRYQLRRFLHISETRAAESELEPQQHQLLLAIKGLPEGDLPTIVRLAERLQLRHHSVVGLIDRLESRGFVRRRRDPVDHRRVLVELTAQGDVVLQELSQAHEVELREMAPALLSALQAVIGRAETVGPRRSS